ncbi:MAG: hypothetical protein RM021_008405 [Nostoc sp. EkiNYC01]|nr:hypothetical protein [Nostoc sp. EkiNYC01]
MGLGNIYRNRILGNRAENLEFAIAAFSAALEVFTRSAFPEKWAGKGGLRGVIRFVYTQVLKTSSLKAT